MARRRPRAVRRQKTSALPRYPVRQCNDRHPQGNRMYGFARSAGVSPASSEGILASQNNSRGRDGPVRAGKMPALRVHAIALPSPRLALPGTPSAHNMEIRT